MMAKTARNSNIELLRILSMCVIIAGHFVAQCGLFEYTLCVNDYLIAVISGGSRIAVNVFALIGVWYMVDAKFNAGRILKLYVQLYLFTSFFTIVALIIDYRAVSFKNVIYGFVPFIGRTLWFASSYLCLLIFKPFLDLILQWEKKKLIIFTSLFFVLMSIFSSILTVQEGFLVDTVWFATVYLVVGTIKKYPPTLNWRGLYSLILFGGGGYIVLVTAKFFADLSECDNILIQLIRRACKIYRGDIKSFPNIVLAALLFHCFITMKPRMNRFINSASKGTFSVYIIHQVPAFYPLLWSTFFRSATWLPKHNFLYVIFVPIVVFTVCSIIDIPRRKWLEPMFSKTKLFEIITAQIEKMYN